MPSDASERLEAALGELAPEQKVVMGLRLGLRFHDIPEEYKEVLEGIEKEHTRKAVSEILGIGTKRIKTIEGEVLAQLGVDPSLDIKGLQTIMYGRN